MTEKKSVKKIKEWIMTFTEADGHMPRDTGPTSAQPAHAIQEERLLSWSLLFRLGELSHVIAGVHPPRSYPHLQLYLYLYQVIGLNRGLSSRGKGRAVRQRQSVGHFFHWTEKDPRGRGVAGVWERPNSSTQGKPCSLWNTY